MGDFPSFWDGALLFCGGHLALWCCPEEDEDSPWYPGSWESHGEDFRDPPCSAPTEWDGTWGIYGTCFAGTCGGGERPKVKLSLNYGQECSCTAAVLTDWSLGMVTMTLPAAPFSGVGTWTVYLGCETLSMQVEFVAGQTADYEMTVSGACEDIFSSSGICAIRSRITAQFPSGEWKDLDTTTYVWKQSYNCTRSAGQYCVCPTLYYRFMDGHGPLIKHENYGGTFDEQYSLIITHMVGSYATASRADEVVDGYETEIADYAEKCLCDYSCTTNGDPICTAGEMSGPYNGVFSPGFAGCETEPGGCQYSSMHVVEWSVDCYGSGYTFYFELKDPATGDWHEIGSVAAPGSFATGEFRIPPCGYSRVWLTADAGASGEYYFGGDMYPIGTNDDCTSAIEAAFETVPAY